MNKRLTRDDFEYCLEVEAPGGEEYEFQMLLANRIDYILPVHIMIGEKKQMRYCASGYKPLEYSFERRLISAEQILCLIESILNAIENVKKYLLSPHNLVLEPDCLFFSHDNRRAALVYVPGYDKDIMVQLRELMECLLGKIEQNDVTSIMLSWRLYMMFKDEHTTLTEIRKMLSTNQSHFANQPSKEQESVFREVHCEKQEKPTWFEIAAWIGIIGVCLFIVTEGVLLYLIYAGGIMIWKRNLLVVNTILLIASLFGAAALYKRQKVEKELWNLQERAIKKEK